MKILVTGAKGFVGKNLCWALKNIQAGKDKTHPNLTIEAVFEFDLDSAPEELEAWCNDCDFVFNLAVRRSRASSWSETLDSLLHCLIHLRNMIISAQ